jgi:predicted oxidoreductase
MKKVNFGGTGLQVPAIVAGCMRLDRLDVTEAANYIENAVAHDVNFFDHADIYGGGNCEELFGKALKLTGIDRENLFIQSKCGIVRGVMYDLSKEHILASVDGILKRLDMEYLDSLLLHRPDALVEPEEVAAAFDELERSGKVRHFGISNMKPMQIELLKKCVEQPLSVNQLQVSAVHSSMIGNGMEVNMLTNGAIDRDGSVLDYCRLKDITIQAWSPLQYRSGTIKGAFFQYDNFTVLNQKLEEMGEKYGVSAAAMAVAWLLRHPARMQVLVGTVNAERFNELCKACDVRLSREDWYQIFKAGGNVLP